MSRSIHTTRRTIRNLVRKSADEKEIEKARREKIRKRLIKKMVRRERRPPTKPIGSSSVRNIEIDLRDESENVVHGATRADVEAILSLLPEAAWDGISRIQLSLGKAYQEEWLLRETTDSYFCDPITGRAGNEILPGVFCGLVLGTYQPRKGMINLYGFVINSLQALPIRVLRLYLRLHALQTLIHEVAHHHDHSTRVQRGRWLADRKENVENYAEKMEFEWTRSIVVPYLENSYPAETEEFLTWVAQHGGIRLKLEFFAADPRSTERNGLIRLAWSGSNAFESWVKGFPRFSGLVESRLGFAEETHYKDRYGECIQIIEGILSENPEHVSARVLKADTLVHLERLEEAEPVITQLLAEDARNAPALGVRGQILRTRKEWRGVLENSERWLAALAPDSKERSRAIVSGAVALCALGDFATLDSRLAELAAAGPLRDAAFLKRYIFRSAGRELEAVEKDS